MSDIKLRISVSLDASASSVFSPLEKASERARTKVKKDMEQAASADPFKRSAKEVDKAQQDLAKAAQKSQDAMTKDVARAAKERVRLEKEAMREIERDLKAHQREVERAAKEEARIEKEALRDIQAERKRRDKEKRDRDREEQANRRASAHAASTVTRLGSGALSFAGRMMGDIARGAGIDLSPANFVSKYMEKGKLATQVSIHGYNPASDQAANRERVPGADLQRQAEEVGKFAAYDPSEALKGLDAFVKLTGDLETGRAALKPLAELARATGSEFKDMIEAAGPVSKNLGDVGKVFKTADDKAKAVVAVLSAYAAQGKIGSVDISDLAKVMPKIAAAAGQLSGKTQQDKISNMLTLGALAQESRGVGGATSPQEAASAAMGVVNALKRTTTIKKWEDKYKINTRDSSGQIMPIDKLIEASLVTTRGDARKMGDLWKSVIADRAVTGFSNAYRQAYAGYKGPEKGEALEHARNRAGLAAVREEFKQYDARLTKEDIGIDFKRSMNDPAAKAANVQNNLQILADRMITSLLPALEDIAQGIEKLVSFFLGTPADKAGTGAGHASDAEAAVAGAKTDVDRRAAARKALAAAEESSKAFAENAAAGARASIGPSWGDAYLASLTFGQAGSFDAVGDAIKGGFGTGHAKEASTYRAKADEAFESTKTSMMAYAKARTDAGAEGQAWPTVEQAGKALSSGDSKAIQEIFKLFSTNPTTGKADPAARAAETQAEAAKQNAEAARQNADAARTFSSAVDRMPKGGGGGPGANMGGRAPSGATVSD